jgi:hypothetical protein
MRRCCCSALLAALIGTVSVCAQNADSKKAPPKKGTVFVIPSAPRDVDVIKKDEKPDPKAAKEKLVANGWFNAKLTKLDGSDMAVQYTWRYAVINPEAYAQYVDLYNQWVAAFGIEDPDERLQALQDIYSQAVPVAQTVWSIEEKQIDYRLGFNDQLKVRVATLPPVFDDNGKRRAYSAKELRELKGGANLPGYTAKLEDLKENQLVRIYFVKKKKADNVFMDKSEPIALEATAIIILGESPAESKKDP